MLSARPKIAELVFQCYGRSVHPELFEIQQERLIERTHYRALIRITSAGHAITWLHPEGWVLTEVATSAHHPLPVKRRLMSHHVRGTRTDYIECGGGIRYETEFALEAVDSQTLRDYQHEFLLAGPQQGLMYQFDSAGRLGLNAFSYIHVESRARSLQIQALHTFPDDNAILKSQSAFLLSGAG